MTSEEMHEIDFLKSVIGKDMANWHVSFFGPFKDIDDGKMIAQKYLDAGFIQKAKPSVALEVLKTFDLKEILKSANLKLNGKKAELIQRIIDNVSNVEQIENYPLVFDLTASGQDFLKKYFNILLSAVKDIYDLLVSEKFEEAYLKSKQYTNGEKSSEGSDTISSDSYSFEHKAACKQYLSDENAPASQKEKRIYLLYSWLPSRFNEPIAELAAGLEITAEYVRWNHDYISSLLEINRYKAIEARRYVIHTCRDCRVCDKCHQISERILPISEIVIGENFPPLHNECRCYASVLLDEALTDCPMR